MLGISRISFLINSTVQYFHGMLWECFGKLGIFGQVRMVYDQKGKPRGCGKVWLMLRRKSRVVRASRNTNLAWSAGISTNTIATTGLLGLISRGYFWKMVRQEVFEEADNFSLKQVT